MFFLADRCLFFNQGFLERTASKIAYPFLLFSGGISDLMQGWTESKNSYQTLATKFDTLKLDYMNLIDQFIELRATHKQCASIPEITRFNERYNKQNNVMAKILLRHLDTDEHYMLINKGTRHGVAKDMVAVYQNHLLGRVHETYDWYSKILLITDQRCSVAAYASSTQAAGIVKGFNNDTRCTFNYVSHLFTVKDNDMVISSGQGLVFPEGFCLGRICLQSIKEKALYHHIEIEPIVNVRLINFCWIVNGLAVEGTTAQR